MLEPVVLAAVDVGVAVVAVFATLATLALEAEAAARRLFVVSIIPQPRKSVPKR